MNHDYDVRAYAVGEVPKDVLEHGVALAENGGAVDPEAVVVELPLATVVAIAYGEGLVVGVGAIKRARRDYATLIAARSHYPFPPDTLELGYVAVHPAHWRKGLSHRIVATLLDAHVGTLFATTSDYRMKSTLDQAGFELRGTEWQGTASLLSLWIRHPS